MTSLLKNVLFVSGVNPQTSQTVFKNYFDRYGPILDLQLVKQPGNSRLNLGYGLVHFDHPASVQHVVESKEIPFLDGVLMSIKPAETKEEASQEEQVESQDKKDVSNQFRVWLVGLTTTITKQQIVDYCSQFGSVLSVTLCNPVGTTRFGLVSFGSRKSQQTAIQHVDHQIAGVPVSVRVVKSPKRVSKKKSLDGY